MIGFVLVDGDENHRKALEAARNTISKEDREYGGVYVFNHYRAALVTPDMSEVGAPWNVIYGPANEDNDQVQPASSKELALEMAERYVSTGTINAE
jgi:hypothetical protein